MTIIVPALAAILALASPNLDTVFLRDGGRLRGTVVEETPGTGVTIQLPDGELRKVPAANVARVEYGDGSQGGAGAPPVAPPNAAPGAAEPLPPIEPQPWAQPLPPEEAPPDRIKNPHRFTVAGYMGVEVPSGEAQPGLDMTDVTTTAFLLGVEGAFRVIPELQLGLLLDLGFGGAGPRLEQDCDFYGTSCTTTSVNLGIFARWVFTPREPTTPWVAVGAATGILSIDPASTDVCGGAYGGNELRLSAGYDFRRNGQFGFGVFAGAAFGKYTDVGVYTSAGCQDLEYQALPETSSHTWIQAGVRAIILP